MFTGIIESKGKLQRTEKVQGGRRFVVEVPAHIGGRHGATSARTERGLSALESTSDWSDECKLGASVAVNGVCLTVAEKSGQTLHFDVINETLQKTNLGQYKAGDVLNLERALRVGDRLDGHFVQGHVDGTARIEEIVADAQEWTVHFRPEEHLMPCIIPKGSIAIDGVSLTIASVSAMTCSVALIPTTLEVTNLGSRRKGDQVNIETDMLIRALLHRMDTVGAVFSTHAHSPSGITQVMLDKAGFK